MGISEHKGLSLVEITASDLGVGPTDTPTFAQIILTDPPTLDNNGATKAYVDSIVQGVTTLTGTASQVLVNGTSGSATSGAITLTLPQNIATSSAPTFGGLTLTGTLNSTTINSSALTASRAIVSDGSKNLSSSSVTDTELGYVSGVTSAIQTQLNNKQTLNANLTSIAALTPTTGLFLIGNGSGYANTNNFSFSSGVFKIGSSLGVTNGSSIGDGASNIECGVGQGSSNYLQTIWNYNATASSAYAEIKTKSGSNNIVFQKDGGKAIFANTALALYDTAANNTVTFKINEDQASDRTLNWVLGASDRTITLSGSPTLGDWFDQSVKTTATPAFARLDVDNLRLDGNTLSSTDASGILLLDTNGGSIALVDNAVCGASGTSLTSGFTVSRSSNPRIWLYETGASTDNKIWEQLANSGTYKFRVAVDDLSNSVSVYEVTRSGVGSLGFTFPYAAVTMSNLLNVDNLRLDGNTLSSTNTNGNILLTPNGTGKIDFSASPSDYRQVRLGGGNQYGYQYGSFAALGDGVSWGYNFYYDAAGTAVYGTTGGAVSRITVGYGSITLATNIDGGVVPQTALTIASNQQSTFAKQANFTEQISIGATAGTTMTTTTAGLSLYGADVGHYKIGFDSQGSTKGYIRYNTNSDGTDTYGHIFSVSTSGSPNSFTDVMFLSASTKVGIGTDAPAEKLHVNGNIRTNSTQTVYCDNFIGLSGTMTIGTAGADAMLFKQSSSERMRIASGGNIGIGTTSPGAALEIGGTGTLRIAGATASTGTPVIIDGSGDLRPQTSSRRYKNNIVPVGFDTSKIFTLQNMEWDYKTGGHGLSPIAEDAVEIDPFFVNYNTKNEPESLRNDVIQYAMLEELRKLKQEVEILKAARS